MTGPDRFKEVDRLFQAVCDLAPDDRIEALNQAAPGDPSLREEVLGLLRAESSAETALTPSAMASCFAEAFSAGADDPASVGAYTIVRRLGEGGMGVVYEARQSSPNRRVAVKLLRPALGSQQAFRRFEFEIEAIGRLAHANIAQAFEAGVADTPAGPRPYFAMELVDGDRLDRWASGRPLRDRLEMFTRICDAVHHAHTRGVLHRDLKPANIMVTPDGVPKVLDFGVARTLEEDGRGSLMTMSGQVLGTPAYMSPEQFIGGDDGVDTRSDVYALGVVLYQLVSGELPHDVLGKSAFAAAQIVREQPTRPLSKVSPTAAGDIETIATKALERDKSRRYQSASELRDDVQRFLDGRTITARPPSVSYQLSRFARRHAAAVTGAGLAIIALLVGMVATSVAMLNAVEQRDLARAERAEARRQSGIAAAVTDFLNEDVLATVTASALGKDATVRQAVDAAADGLDGRFVDQPETGAAIEVSIGNVYNALGEYERAESLLRNAHATLAERRGASDPMTLDVSKDLAAVLREAGNFDEARRLLILALDAYERALGPTADPTLDTIVELAQIELDGFGDPDASAAWVHRFDQRRPTGMTDDHPVAMKADMRRGALAIHTRDFGPAIEAYERLAITRAATYGERHHATMAVYHNLAVSYEAVGRYADAEPLYARTLAFAREMSGPDNPSTLVTAHNLAYLYESMGRFDEAEPLYIDTLERCRRVFGPTHPGTLTCSQSLASLYRETDRLKESVALLRRVHEDALDELGPDAPPVVEIAWKLAVVLTEQGEPDEAIGLLERSIASVRFRLPPDHPMLGMMLAAEGKCLYRLNRHAEAIRSLEASETILSNHSTAEYIAHVETVRDYLSRARSALAADPSADVE